MSSGNIIAEDFTKAFTTHYYHDQLNNNNTSRECERQEPSGAPHLVQLCPPALRGVSGVFEFLISRPRARRRARPSSPPDTWNGYNLPLTHIDPLGRETKYTYATNNTDVLTVQQLTTLPSTFTTIATYGSYNTQHEPQTYTGADGQTWHYTYNAAGQLATVTDPNSGVTTHNYDASGRLSTIVERQQRNGAHPHLRLRRPRAYQHGSQGYVLTYAYDNLDRVTSITYPDSTTDLYDYTFQSGPYVGHGVAGAAQAHRPPWPRHDLCL